MRKTSLLLVCLTLVATLLSCGERKGKLLVPDSLRYTDQDVPLEELSTGNVNTDSLATLDEMKRLSSSADSLIEGRPVSFYLQRSDVSLTAKNFYLLRFIPSDNEETFALCDSLSTKNDTTRPFYYFLFLRFYRLGGEWTTDPELLPQSAIHYSMEFVDEFYRKLQMPQYRWSYHYWVESLSLNKFPVDDIKDYLIKVQMKRAKKPSRELRQQIAAFGDSIIKHNGQN